MSKKIILGILAIFLLLFLLSACGGEGDGTTAPIGGTTEAPDAVTTGAPTSDPSSGTEAPGQTTGSIFVPDPDAPVAFSYSNVLDIDRALTLGGIQNEEKWLASEDSLFKKWTEALYGQDVKHPNYEGYQEFHQYQQIVLLADSENQKFGLPWLRYDCLYNEGVSYIQTTHPELLWDVTLSPELTAAEQLAVLLPEAPNLHNAEHFPQYDNIYTKEIQMRDRWITLEENVVVHFEDITVSVLVYHRADAPGDEFIFFYEGMMVYGWGWPADMLENEDFWSRFYLSEIDPPV